ncbi:hypothetical protein GCM10022627_28020 [Haloarcula argentinensis]|uniref:Uncharacterized protein n=1 Tax=Haloarcula argentinensis TaxID=43776 RepID=A0A830FV56_HALAR|nr:hypothetical protein GCM10009006_24370 [Haloarcula argentinensis]
MGASGVNTAHDNYNAVLSEQKEYTRTTGSESYETDATSDHRTDREHGHRFPEWVSRIGREQRQRRRRGKTHGFVAGTSYRY